MPLEETRLTLWCGLAIAVAGLFWTVPGFNVLGSLAGMTGLILIIARLGFRRGFMLSLGGLLAAFATGYSIPLSGSGDGLGTGVITAAMFSGLLIAPGFIMGGASRRLDTPLKVLLKGLIPIVILLVLGSFYYFQIINDLPATTKQVNDFISSEITKNPQLSTLINSRYGNAADAIAQFLNETDKIFEVFIKILPGLLIICAVGFLLICQTIAGAYSTKLQIMIPRFRQFYLWQASDWWLIPTAVGLALMVFMRDDFWFYGGVNLIIVTGHVYAVVGMAVIESFMKRYSIPLLAKIIFYLFILFTIWMSFIVFAIIGLADSRFNFKRENLDIEDKNIG